MGFKDYKELLMNNLEFYIDHRVDKIKQKTSRIKTSLKQRVLEFYRKFLNAPKTQIEVTRAEREYADVVKLLEEDVQYVRRTGRYYTIGSVALRDITCQRLYKTEANADN